MLHNIAVRARGPLDIREEDEEVEEENEEGIRPHDDQGMFNTWLGFMHVSK